MYGLNIHLQSFILNRSLIHSGDKIRVSITSVPDEYKEAFVVDCDKSNNVHHFFTINVTNQTKKIIFVFRKKSFINNDPIIASTIVQIKDLPQSDTDTNNTEVKTIDIYEPIQHMQHSAFAVQNRPVYGQMRIQFTPTTAFPPSAFKHGQKKRNTGNAEMVTLTNPNKSYGSYGYVSNENQNKQQRYDNQGLFVDPDPEQIKTLHQFDNQFQPQQNQYQQQPQQQQYQYQQQNQYQQQPQNQYQYQQQNQYQQQPQNQYQYQQPNQYQQQPQNQYQYQQPNQYQQQQPQMQNQCQPQQPKGMVFVNDLI